MGLYIHVLLAEANNHCGAIPEMGIRQLFYAILILISGSFSDCQLQLFFFTQSLDITGIVAWACRSVTATSGPRRARPWNRFWWAHNTTLRLWIFFPIFLQWTKIFWLFHTAWAYILYQFYLTPASLNIPFFFDQNTTSPIRTPCFGLHHAAPPRLDTPGTQKWPHHVHLLFSPTFQSWKVIWKPVGFSNQVKSLEGSSERQLYGQVGGSSPLLPCSASDQLDLTSQSRDLHSLSLTLGLLCLSWNRRSQLQYIIIFPVRHY